MPDITQRIADILGDEWTDDIGNPPLTYEFENIQQWTEHVAEVLTTELGLTQEWTWSWPNGSAMGVPGYGFSVPTRDEAVLEADSYMNVVSRYVTGWVPDE